MGFARPIVFWIAIFAALAVVVVVLHEVLLPFVAGMVLAYLLNPVAGRLERLGIGRGLATVAIVVFAVIAVVALTVLVVPVIVRELAYFIDSFPLYLRQLHTLATDPSHPWLSKIIGEGLGESERSVGELTSLAERTRAAHVRRSEIGRTFASTQMGQAPEGGKHCCAG